MLIQIAIAVMSLSATYLSVHPTRQRYAGFVGLGVQPFWLVTTYANQQWGMFALCFVYGALWGRSLWQHWIKKPSVSA